MRHHLLLTLCTLALLSNAAHCDAATFSVGAGGSHTTDSTFTMSVFVSSEGTESINAVGSSLSYPRDIVRLVSITDPGLVSLWAEKPSYSNEAGTASFQGIMYNPGFTGSQGKILTLTFKAIAPGTGKVEFKRPTILANDGTGTEILSGTKGTTITIVTGNPRAQATPASAPATVVATTTPGTLAAPVALTDDTPAPKTTPSPTAPPAPAPASTSGWLLFALFTVPGFLFLFGVVGWLLWPRIALLMRTTSRVLTSYDEELKHEMYVVHYAITEEMKRLHHERSERQLTMAERRIFMRFSVLQERIEHMMGHDTQKGDH